MTRHDRTRDFFELLGVEEGRCRPRFAFDGKIDLIKPEAQMSEKRSQVSDLDLVVRIEFVAAFPAIDETLDLRLEAGGIGCDRVQRRPVADQGRRDDDQDACRDNSGDDRVALIDDVFAAPHPDIAQHLARLNGREGVVNFENDVPA